jgi:hypothetical protein
VPFLCAIGAWFASRRDAASRRALVAGATSVIGAVLVWLITDRLMRAAGYRHLAPETTQPIGSLSELGGNATLLARLVFDLGNGALAFSTKGPLEGLLALLCAGVSLAGVALPVLWLARVARRARPALLVHLTFWSVVVVALAAAMLVTTLGVDLGSTRYVIPMLFAATVTAPLLLDVGPRARVAAILGAVVVVTGSVVSLADRTTSGLAPTTRAMLAAIERTAAQTGARTGFGAYELASNVTWATDGRVVARPVEDWTTPGRVCGFPTARDASWYRPTGAPRTFLLWPGPQPPASLGRPARAQPIGGGATMFVYDADLARRICPPSDRTTPPDA